MLTRADLLPARLARGDHNLAADLTVFRLISLLDLPDLLVELLVVSPHKVGHFQIVAGRVGGSRFSGDEDLTKTGLRCAG